MNETQKWKNEMRFTDNFWRAVCHSNAHKSKQEVLKMYSHLSENRWKCCLCSLQYSTLNIFLYGYISNITQKCYVVKQFFLANLMLPSSPYHLNKFSLISIYGYWLLGFESVVYLGMAALIYYESREAKLVILSKKLPLHSIGKQFWVTYYC
jgi:hypothetical protein